MAGVLGRILSPQTQRRLIERSEKTLRVDHKALELQTAMEILAEVFGIRISEVEEMLLQRSEVEVQSCCGEGTLWPESFCLAE